ncbi:LysR family transcriptional regulator substrate-binding protein [Microbacteriaceae bacterium VKM Ac-2855]|nr:LysR family transcriptional regulator substrate-binding protein [Microbacteriaceae bacterium VKM Ac-2855]
MSEQTEPDPIEPADTAQSRPTFRLALVPGVTPTTWTRVWAQRRPELPLAVTPIAEAEQERSLLEGSADVAFIRGPLTDEHLSAIALYDEQPVVVVARDHALAEAAGVDVADLAQEHLLQDPSAVPEWAAVAAELADGSRRALPRMRDLDDAAEQVAAGVGILILPQSLARVHGRKDTRTVALTGVAETRISLAWVTAAKTDDVEDFIGVVRGRSANSTRGRDLEAEAAEAKAVQKAAKAKKVAAKRAADRAKRPAAPSKPVAQRYQPRKPKRK